MAEISTELSKIDGRVPTLKEGLRFVHVWFATGIADEAKRYAAMRRDRIGSIVPWQAIAAFGVWRRQSLLSHLDRAVQVSDPEERRRQASEINNVIASDQGGKIAVELPAQWEELAREAGQLARLYRAVRVAIKLQEWHVDNGAYPEELSQIQSAIEPFTVRYKRSDDGQGYTIFGEATDNEPLLNLHRSVLVH